MLKSQINHDKGTEIVGEITSKGCTQGVKHTAVDSLKRYAEFLVMRYSHQGR